MTFDPKSIMVPPEAERAEAEADSLFRMVDAYDVDSPEMYQAAGSELQTIRARHAAIEKERVHIKEPFLEGCRRIDAFFKVPLDRLAQAGDLLKNRMLTFQTAERQRQEEARRAAEDIARRERAEQERVRREAEEVERKARAAMQAAANEADRRIAEAEANAAQEAAQEAQAQIELAEVAPVAMPVVALPAAEGISTRATWKAEVVDFPALVKAAAEAHAKGDPTLLGYLQANEKAIGQVARALKAQARIPGVRIFAQDSLSVRTAA
jgi:hypothetical protein